jgi:hypothetical protein
MSSRIKFVDSYLTEVTVDRAPSGRIRIDTKPRDEKKKEHCISMTESQARILLSALEDILELTE